MRGALYPDDDTADITHPSYQHIPARHRLRPWRAATITCGCLAVAALVALIMHAVLARDAAEDPAAVYLRLATVTTVILTVLLGTGYGLACGQVAERRRMVAALHEDLHREVQVIRALVASAVSGQIDPDSADALRRISMRLVRPGE